MPDPGQPSLQVITPSFARDVELCADLNRSLLDLSPPSVRHQIIVPPTDIPLFARLAGDRTEVVAEPEFLPRGFVRSPVGNYMVNLRRPFPPVRGWITQQLIKIAAAARSQADVVVIVDSDIAFVRPFTAQTFLRDGVVRFFRKPDFIDGRLPRHVRWHGVARQMLGVPAARPPYPDYISSMLAWDPALVRRMLARIEQVRDRRWTSVIGGALHFSEWTLYGVFVDEMAGDRAASFASDRSLCHDYWDRVPLDAESATRFIAQIGPDDVAVMISAQSFTPVDVRREALTAIRAQLNPAH